MPPTRSCVELFFDWRVWIQPPPLSKLNSVRTRRFAALGKNRLAKRNTNSGKPPSQSPADISTENKQLMADYFPAFPSNKSKGQI